MMTSLIVRMMMTLMRRMTAQGSCVYDGGSGRTSKDDDDDDDIDGEDDDDIDVDDDNIDIDDDDDIDGEVMCLQRRQVLKRQKS